MAVEDKYTDSNVVAGKKGNPANMHGAQCHAVTAVVSIAAADADGSVYRFLKGIPGHLVPIKIEVKCDAITGGTDFDIGFYKTDFGAVIDKDNLADGLDLSSAATKDGLSAVANASLGKKLYELAGHTSSTQLPAYDLALTGNTVGTAAGSVAITCWFAQG